MVRMKQVAVWTLGVAACALPMAVWGQATATTVVTIQNKQAEPVSANSMVVQVNGKTEPVMKLEALDPAQTEVAVLLDDGLRWSIGRQLSDIKDFIKGLPAGVPAMVGYMQNGRVVGSQGFSTNHDEVAASVRLPLSSPGVSASPYFTLSDMAKNWPREAESYGQAPTRQHGPGARFVLLITNGVDPYNGSVSPLNQNSTYVNTAVRDAQRAGLNVYSIYYGNAGIGGQLASFSGQSYLTQVAEGTGGQLLYQLRGAPPSLAPYFKNFQEAIDNSRLATFAVPGGHNLVNIRFKSKEKGIKVRATQAVRASEE